MSVRLFHRGARFVFVVRRGEAGDERWWSPHGRPPDWRAILGGQLALLGLSPASRRDHAHLSCRVGTLDWTARRRWSIIELRLNGGSETKRRLVAAALLKAARYARPASDISEDGQWRA